MSVRPLHSLPPLLVLLALAATGPATGSPQTGHEGHEGHDPSAMTDAAMQAATIEYWKTHRPIPALAPAGTGARTLGADATFTVSGTRFNADGSTATAVDTVRITVGQTVLWQWVNGFHTITSGTGFDDKNSGLVFDQPSDENNPQFFHTFTQVETVPFYCQPHEGFGMKGVVVVSAAVGVEEPRAAGIGFRGEPWPNPSRAGASFRFALANPASVRSDVVDAQGRHVADIADRTFDAGEHVLAWDGRGARGPVAAGVYYLRLRAPGFVGARSITIRR